MQAQAWGLEVAGLTPQLAAYFGLPPGQPGLLVRSVAPGSAASQAGLAAGDILIRWGGRPLARPSDVPPPTHGATLELFRRGKKQGVQIAPSGATL